MRCSKCGTDAPATAAHCLHCGAALAAVSVVTGVMTPPQRSADPVISDISTLAPSGADDLTRATSHGDSSPRLSAGILVPGEIVGRRYHIIQLIGEGGMGVVYQAWDAELGIPVALKMIRPDVKGDAAAQATVERRIKQELLLARQVTDKHVVRIHDLGDIDGIKYITMPYVRGADLATMMRQR